MNPHPSVPASRSLTLLTMGGRRYFRHAELEYHEDEEWVFLDKDGHFVDLDSSIDPSGGARRGHGNKSWDECKRGARHTIMVGVVKDLEKERQEKWRETHAEIVACLKSTAESIERARKESQEADARIQKRQEDFQKRLEESNVKHADSGLEVVDPLEEGQKKSPPELLSATPVSALMGSPALSIVASSANVPTFELILLGSGGGRKTAFVDSLTKTSEPSDVQYDGVVTPLLFQTNFHRKHLLRHD